MTGNPACPFQAPDLTKPAGKDEAQFADWFHNHVWEAEAYQADRLSLSQEVLVPFVLPPGKIVMLGSHNGVVFQA